MQTEKIDFSTDVIASYYDLTNKSEEFMEKAKQYFSNYKMKPFRFSRFMHLLRITDVIISDEGVVNKKNICELQDISRKVNKNFRKKINKVIDDVKNIADIKDKNISEPSEKQLFSFINKNNVDVIKNICAQNSDASVEDNILQISKALLILLKRERFDLSELNAYSVQDLHINDGVVKYFNFKECIMLWKYANASLRRNSNEYVVDAWNEIEFNFIKTRDDIKSNRLNQYWKNKTNEKVRKYAILYGIAQLWNIDIPEIPQIKEDISPILESSDVIDLLNEQVYGIKLEKWIIFFDRLRNFLKKGRLQ